MRGYFGIGVINLKKELNYGTLFRSAYCFGADFIFLIGKRFTKQCSDTVCSYRHIPLFEYQSCDDFIEHIPYDCQLVGVEICEKSHPILNYVHPERAIYILGPEDGTINNEILDHCKTVIQIPTKYCLNVAVAGSIVLFDRVNKLGI
jgi:tRNA G18 (ribose-2'-O)-methylase SpoU